MIRNLLVLVIRWLRVTIWDVITIVFGIKSSYLILPNVLTHKLHFNNPNLIELIQSVIIVLSETDFEVLGNQI